MEELMHNILKSCCNKERSMQLLLVLFFLSAPLLYGEQSCLWENDFIKSLALSKQTNKNLLLFFTGSDWSGPSMKMKKEILDSAEFRETLRDDFIFVQIDFPRHSPLGEGQLAQNRMLQEQFKITHFPCLLLLDQHKREITRLDYLPEEKENLSHQLLRVVALDRKLIAALTLLENKGFLSGKQLQELYTMAEELDRSHEMAI